MHNKVNDKLRKQGYLNTPDPTPCDVVNRFINMWEKDPHFWEHPTWNFLATVVFNYTPDDPDKTKAYNEFSHILPLVLPKTKITEKYKKIIQSNPPDFSSQDALIKWYYDFIKKLDPSVFETFNDYKDTFEIRRAKCAQSSCRTLTAKAAAKKSSTKPLFEVITHEKNKHMHGHNHDEHDEHYDHPGPHEDHDPKICHIHHKKN